MKNAIFRKAPEVPDESGTSALPHGLRECVKIAVCVLFLAASGFLWLSIDSTLGKVLYYVLFLIPNFICAEWLSGKIFSEERLSITERWSAPVRIFTGVMVGLVVLGAMCCLNLFGRWLLAK